MDRLLICDEGFKEVLPKILSMNGVAKLPIDIESFTKPEHFEVSFNCVQVGWWIWGWVLGCCPFIMSAFFVFGFSIPHGF